MSQRRILLIDADRTFHELLTRELGPYGFEIVCDDSPQALTRLEELGAVALFIAVEEPERKGYALFNRAKKGVGAALPMVLVTNTVAPEVFANHRRLKVHADDYLDKRELSIDVLIGKIDNLLGPLDEPAVDLPIEIDDAPLEDEVLVDEVDGADLDLGAIDDFADDANHTVEAQPPAVDHLLDEETDAAFAGLMIDDSPFGPPRARAAEPRQRPVPITQRDLHGAREPIDLSPRPLPSIEPEPLPRFPEAVPEPIATFEFDVAADDVTSDRSSGADQPLNPPLAARSAWTAGPFDDLDASATPEPIAEFEPADYGSTAELLPFDSGAELLPFDSQVELAPYESQAELAPITAQVELAPFESTAELPRDTPPASGPPNRFAPPTDIVITHDAESTDVTQLAPLPEPPIATEPPAREPGPTARRLPRVTETPYASAPAPARDLSLDLGLDEVAARAVEEQSGVHDRRTLQKIHLVERDNQRLKAELEKARQGESGSNQGSSREREFLNLRGMLTAKDKELLELRDNLAQTNREMAEVRDRVSQLQHAKAATDAKNLELESRLLADSERTENETSALQEARAKVATLEQRLARVQNDLDRQVALGNEAKIAQKATEKVRADNEAMRTAHEQANAEHAEVVARLHAEHERALAEAAGERRAALTALSAELEQARVAAIASVGTDAEEARKALHEAHAAALAERDQQLRAASQLSDEALAAARATERTHAAEERAALRATHEQALQQLEADRAAELDAARAQREASIHALEERMAQALAAAADERVEAVAAAETEALRAVAEQVQASAERAAQEFAAAHDQQLAALATAHRDALEHVRADGHAERAALEDRLTSEHQQAMDSAAVAAAQALDRERAALEVAAATALHQLEERLTNEQRQLEARLVAEQGQLAELAAAERRVILERHDAEHEQAVNALTANHEAALANERTERATALADLQRNHDAALATARADARAAQDASALEHVEIIARLQASHEAAMAHVAEQRQTDLATAAAEHAAALAQAVSHHDAAQTAARAEMRTEVEELERGLATARGVARRLDNELLVARTAITERDHALVEHQGAIAVRDQRIEELGAQIDEIERENATFQDQIVQAYQKIKNDEAVVARAKKALAIALTTLDDGPSKPTS